MLSENLELPASDCSWQVPLGMGDPERIPKGHPSRELSRLGTSRPRSQMTKTRVLSGYRLLICISTRTLWESSYFQVHYTQYVSEQICAFRGSLFNIFSICSWLQIYLFIYLFIVIVVVVVLLLIITKLNYLKPLSYLILLLSAVHWASLMLAQCLH